MRSHLTGGHDGLRHFSSLGATPKRRKRFASLRRSNRTSPEVSPGWLPSRKDARTGEKRWSVGTPVSQSFPVIRSHLTGGHDGLRHLEECEHGAKLTKLGTRLPRFLIPRR